jgi:membrane protein DedA with SNARE-associated domain
MKLSRGRSTMPRDGRFLGRVLVIATLIRDYGYLAILVGTLFEGETIVLLAGAAAHFGYLDLTWIIATALAGSVAGDQLWFMLGRRWGPKITSLRRSWRERAERVHHYLRRHQDWLILSFRFYYGLRTVTPFAIGSAQVPKLRFLGLNLAGAVVWSIAFTFAGYFLGDATDYFLEDKRYGLYALGGAILAVGAILLATRMRRSKAAP